MIKRLLITILTLLLMLSATSCAVLGNATEKYLLAMQNVLNADSLESSSKLEVHLDLTKAKGNVKSDLEKYKDITLNIDHAMDKKTKKQVDNCFLNLGGLPVDFKLYVDGENAYLKSSLLGGKYYKPEQPENMKNIGEANNTREIDVEEYNKFIDEVKKIWVDAVKNEIISKEGTSVENTPDGDIKVTNLSLELTDEKEKNIISNLAELVSKNNLLLEQAKKGSEQYAPKEAKKDEVKKEIEKWFKNLPENMQKLKDQYTLDKLKLTARVDRDSYIINQLLSGGITIKSDDFGEIKIGVKFEETYWNINRKVNVEIPQIKKEDIGDWKDLNSENSDLTKKFNEAFNKK